jgi:hypothetical protein
MYKIKAQSMENNHTNSGIGSKNSGDFIRRLLGLSEKPTKQSPSPPVFNTTFPITQLPREIIQEILKIDRNIIYNNLGYVMCVNCLRKVSIYNIVKKHGMDTALEYARDGKFYCYTCTPPDM